MVCPACTCLCDDIRLGHLQDGSQVFENACHMGDAFFSELSNRSKSIEFFFEGQSVDMEFAIEKAVEILTNAKYPLIAGLGAVGTRAQQLAVNIGRRTGGAVDTTLSALGRAALLALQREGMVTGTLGEVSQRAEVIVFWCCDPVSTHPRLIERYCNRQQRRFIAVDQAITRTSEIADEFIKIAPSGAAASLRVCEGILAGVNFEDRRVCEQTGQSVETWSRWVEELRRCNYGALFFGFEPNTDPSWDASVDCLVSFARRLNAETRFILLPAREDQNALGAENVLAWSTGFAMAVDTCREVGRHHYLEYSAEQILDRGECDAAMVFHDSRANPLCSQSLSQLNSIPRVLIVDSLDDSIDLCRTQSLCVVCDLKLDDDFCRLDDVMLPVTGIISEPTGAHGLRDFLSRLLAKLGS